jgi:DNA-directed RNA polymerase specialized sigma24 family protein
MVRRALAKLPAVYREALALRDIHELSYDEIARRLQLPEGTVKSRINRGRRELARYLRALVEHPPEISRNGTRSRRQEASDAKD